DLRVRGENLLNKGGSGAWQSDDEDRIRVRCAQTGACGKELFGENLYLVASVRFNYFGIVPAFTTLECVATLVKLPRFRILIPFFEGFPEREAQMIAVDKLCGWCGFLGKHLADLALRKAIDL